jgi:3-oxoacyl-[acyl-carrier protein] reductase
MVAETVDRFGGLDILINNHTLRASRPFEELTYEEWRRVLAVVLDGVFFCCKACIPRMLERGGGAIVNLGGQAGITGTRRGAHATAAKSAVAGMTRALALEFADRGITVNTVHPWLIDTERGEGEPVRRGTPPIGRQGTVEEVAALVRLLCGPEGRYITGQSIHINGGGYMP